MTIEAFASALTPDLKAAGRRLGLQRKRRLSTTHRFLGFGFAAADLLLEIRPDGRVSFGLGAGEAVLGVAEEDLSHRAWTSLIAADDHPTVEALFAQLDDGLRAGPIVVRVADNDEDAPARFASLTAIRLPQNHGAISCALTRADGRSGPQDREGFEAAERRRRAAPGKAGQLGEAIRFRQFTLAYQPVVSLADGSLHHHEVLLRFGADGSPFPAIRMAEELDLIEPLDIAVLETALEVLKRDPGLVLAVNVSGRSLMRDTYVDAAVGLLRQTPGVRGRLMIELTESAAVDDLAAADRRLQALRAAGCEVCLDDFGAGAASLAYLQQLTLDVVKIDGRYIRDLAHGGREATFVKHLVNMCAELNVRTLAEMVETPEAEDAVRRAGVDYAQGWLYGRAVETPVSPTAIANQGRLRDAG